MQKRFSIRGPSAVLVVVVIAASTAFASTAASAQGPGASAARKKHHKKPPPSENSQDTSLFNALFAKANDAAKDVAELAAYLATHTVPKAASAANATNASHASSADTVTGQGTLASGQTEIGIIGGRFQNGANANSPMGISTTFPLLAPVALSNSDVEVAPSTHCTGSTSNPTAARGFVCIYPDILVFANLVSGNVGVAGDTKLGFQMEWNATTANSQSSVRAEWAYTAP